MARDRFKSAHMGIMQTYFTPEQARYIDPAKNNGFDPTLSGRPPETIVLDCRGGHPARTRKSIPIKGRGKLVDSCVYCISGDSKSLAQAFPDIAAEWVPGSTPGFTPDNVSHGSMVKLMFQCETHGAYRATVSHRTHNKTGCPQCGRARTTDANIGSAPRVSDLPELAACYLDRNSKPVTGVSAGSSMSFWWRCAECGDECRRSVASFQKGGMRCTGCLKRGNAKVASSRVLSPLVERYPNLAAELIDNRNVPFLSSEVGFQSKKLLWWKCGDCRTEFQRMTVSRTNAGRKPDLLPPGEPNFAVTSGRCKRCNCIPA